MENMRIIRNLSPADSEAWEWAEAMAKHEGRPLEAYLSRLIREERGRVDQRGVLVEEDRAIRRRFAV